MQALGSKVLLEYSYLAARDIPIPIAQAVFYMHPFRVLVKLAKQLGARSVPFEKVGLREVESYRWQRHV